MLFRGTFRPRTFLSFGPVSAPLLPRRAAIDARPEPFSLLAREPDISGFDSASADKFYEGSYSFAGETLRCTPAELFMEQHASSAWIDERDSLVWLKHFLVRPRYLHNRFVSSLLGFWMKHSRPGNAVIGEAQKLTLLTTVLPRLAHQEEAGSYSPYLDAIRLQANRLLRFRPGSPLELCQQSLALIRTGRCHTSFATLLPSALRDLEKGVAGCLRDDGGPASGRISDVIMLLQEVDEISSPEHELLTAKLLKARDNMCAFIAMFEVQPGRWSKLVPRIAQPALEQIQTRAPAIGHAPDSGYTRLEQARTIILSKWGCDRTSATTEIFHDGQPLLEISSGGSTETFHSIGSERAIKADLGELSETRWQCGSRRWSQSCFLSANGEDIRFDECCDPPISPFPMTLRVAGQTKLMVAREGLEATLVQPNGTSWSIRARGAALQKAEQPGLLVLVPPEDAPFHVNWAIKKLLPPKRRGAKAAPASRLDPELPFR